MALKRYKADADTTIVNAYQMDLTTRGTGANTGEADVLETYSIYGRENTGSQELSRMLIKFPITNISTDRTNGVVPASGSVSFYLRMFNARHSKTVPADFKLSIMGISQSWQEGTGLDLEGYKDLTKGNSGANWMSASNTAYWTDQAGTLLAGGSYLTGSSTTETFLFTETFTTGLEDLEVDITPLVEQWIAGTYSNYGLGVHMSASYEAYISGAANTVTNRMPGQPTLDADDTTQSVIYNPSGSTKSYYTKRFFARGSQYFFKHPVIEARWDDKITDDRGEFYYSSSLSTANDNLNTLYLYNYVRGKLSDIPGLGTAKKIYVSLFSGSVGGFYTGGDGDDVAPSDIPISGSTGSVQILSVDNSSFVSSVNKLVATGGIVSTGIYSASFAFTGSTLLETVYDVWFTGSHSTISAVNAITQYFTGTIKPITLKAEPHNVHPTYYLNVTNLQQKYPGNQTARFNVFVREKYWNPTIYTKASSTAKSATVVSASYRVFRTLDAYDAIPYGTGSDLHTLMSYDESGNYFDLDMKLLEPGYEYALKFSFYDSQLSSWTEQNESFKFRVEDYEY